MKTRPTVVIGFCVLATLVLAAFTGRQVMDHSRLSTMPSTVSAAAAGSQVAEGQQQAPTPDRRARGVHNEAIVFDGHIDMGLQLMVPGWKIEDRHAPPATLDGEGSHADLPRMREGGLGAAFFVVFIPGTVTGPRAVEQARGQMAAIHRAVEAHPRDLAFCATAAGIRTARKAGKIAVAMGVEGGHMINEDLAVLRTFAREGMRYLTLTHTVRVPWADSSFDEPKTNGLTPFGRDVVAELNRLGVMVDVSHVSDKTFWDVLSVSRAPVIASHSSCRALCNSPRNLTNDMIRAAAGNGGVVLINFMSVYLDEPLRQEVARRDAAAAALRAGLLQRVPPAAGPPRRDAAPSAVPQTPPPLPVVSFERILDHIDHVVRLVGRDHVGLGPDFYDAAMPEGMEDCTGLPKITEALLRRGYSEGDVRAILGGNLLRVMEDAERTASQLLGKTKG